MQALSAASRRKIWAFPVQDLALTSWACATLRCEDVPLLDAIAAAAIPKLAAIPDLAWRQPGRTRGAGPAAAGGEAVPPDMVHCLAEALSSLGRLREPALAACSEALGRLAARLDAARPAEAATGERPPGAMTPDEPRVLLEQPNVCVLMKPPQWVVTVNNQYAGLGRLEPEDEGGDLLLQSWVARQLGPSCPVAVDVAAQHGIVHRLDRGTSGPLLVARTYRGYFEARLQFAARRVGKEYLCLCRGALEPAPRPLCAPLRVDTRQARRQAEAAPGARPARTQVCRVAHLLGPCGDSEGVDLYGFVEVRLHTGRRHQIRAHLSYEGHPLVGDEVYGRGAEGWCPGLFLHSHLLAFNVGDGPTTVVAPPPAALRRALAALPAADRRAAATLARWLD
mmetsp:Transcript_51264/g.158845  ORF Transcript_51264/g.158845 Transcript_51264/m.158845 type:complete len:395 (-) Transcript_51264:32-1216(-)